MKSAIKVSVLILLLLLAGYSVPADAATYHFGADERQLSSATDEVAAGYYCPTSLHTVDNSLGASNIRSGVNIFGIVGNYEGYEDYGIPKTGQTLVYKTNDDGTYKKGTPTSGDRFTDNGNGTITDNGTGLMWAADGTGAGCNNGNTCTWLNAISFCENSTFAGYDDWRLPNINELTSIVNWATYSPAIDTGYFPHTKTTPGYWSSTTIVDFTGSVWKVDFSSGNVGTNTKTIPYYVRPVRGGQP